MKNEIKAVLSVKKIEKIIREELRKKGITGNISIEWYVDDGVSAVITKTEDFFGANLEMELELFDEDIFRIIRNAFYTTDIDITDISYLGRKIDDDEEFEEDYYDDRWNFFDEDDNEEDYDFDDYDDDYDEDEEEEYKFTGVVVTFKQYSQVKSAPKLKKGGYYARS